MICACVKDGIEKTTEVINLPQQQTLAINFTRQFYWCSVNLTLVIRMFNSSRDMKQDPVNVNGREENMTTDHHKSLTTFLHNRLILPRCCLTSGVRGTTKCCKSGFRTIFNIKFLIDWDSKHYFLYMLQH